MKNFEEKMKHLWQRIEIGSPALVRNLIILPVKWKGKPPRKNGGLVPFHRAIKEGYLRVLETGTVGEIRIGNDSRHLVLGIDGQEVIGGWQNRILKSSILVGEKMQASVPTICVEQGRWDRSSSTFTEGRIAYPTLRTVMACTGDLAGNTQREVWNTVKESLQVMHTFSSTSSMHELYSSVDDQVDSMASEFVTSADQTGSMVIVGGRYLCLDLFGSHDLFLEFWPLLGQSYALDALLHLNKPGDWSSLEGTVKIFAREIDKISGEISQATCLGEDLFFHSEQLHGKALLERDSLFHLSAFLQLCGLK